MFERLTLVEFHLETDEFKPSATASLGDGEEGGGLKRRLRRGASRRSASSESDASDDSTSMESGRARKAGSGLALLAVAGLFLVARHFQGRDRNRNR